MNPTPAILFFCVCLCPTLSLNAGGRIDPAGIPGSLVMSGIGQPSEAIESFYELARPEQAQVVILRLDDHASSIAEAAQLHKAGTAIEVAAGGGRDSSAAVTAIQSATGVWLIAGGQGRLTAAWAGDAVLDALHAVLKRDGVLGGSAAAADAFGEALGFLPGSVIDSQHQVRLSASPVAQAQATAPSLIGFEISKDAALVIQGREIRTVGEAGLVDIHLAAGPSRDATVIRLGDSKARADLTALRHSAVARQSAAFPAEQAPSPEVPNGSLIIIGGGRTPKGLIAQFVSLAGGQDAKIVIFPTAHADPTPPQEKLTRAFRANGAGQVTVLAERRLDRVDSEEYLSQLRKATGIWFGGGRQWRFADAYLDTKALAAMHAVLARGGVIMGSSAGASIQADYLARGNPLGNLDIMAEGYERGLGFIKGVAIDQHFAQRDRFADMATLVDTYPQLLGIGIDESTALIVKGEIGAVAGKNAVHFFDHSRVVTDGQPDYQSVGANGRYNLVTRRIIAE
jgi:cyanophycinase